MKFLSLKYLLSKAEEALLRFPFVLVCAIVAVAVSIFLIGMDNDIVNELLYINMLLTSALGVPLFFCIQIYSEKINLDKGVLKIIFYLTSILFLVYIFWSLPTIEETHNTNIPYIRYGVFNVIIHLLVSFAPYLNSKELNGFWNYNKALFLRLCTSILYSGFIYIGLALALLAIDNLFRINIDGKLYSQLFIIIIGLFNTWFFIAGIPKKLDELEENKEYPKSLKVFSQYILLPLLVLYLLILYTYGTKIIINWNWPKGWVSYLVSGVSILGFFNILLIYPYGKLKNNEWIKKFTNLFYFILIPLVLLLFIAIFMRVNDYGITIKRYSIILLGIWICLVCFYFILKKDNIKFIPVSLAILLLICSFGPWGMFSVSEKSQVKILKKVLEENKILVDGKIANEVLWMNYKLPHFESENQLINNEILSDSLHNQVKSILDYLEDNHGMNKIKPWFSQNLDSMILVSAKNEKYHHYKKAKIYMKSLGLDYRKRYHNNSYNSYQYNTKNNNLIDVKDYNYYYSFNTYRDFTKQLTASKNSIEFSREGDMFSINTKSDTIYIDVASIHQKLLESYGKGTINDISDDSLTFLFDNDDLNVKIKFTTISFTYNKNALKIKTVNGDLFFNEK